MHKKKLELIPVVVTLLVTAKTYINKTLLLIRTSFYAYDPITQVYTSYNQNSKMWQISVEMLKIIHKNKFESVP